MICVETNTCVEWNQMINVVMYYYASSWPQKTRQHSIVLDSVVRIPIFFFFRFFFWYLLFFVLIHVFVSLNWLIFRKECLSLYVTELLCKWWQFCWLLVQPIALIIHNICPNKFKSTYASFVLIKIAVRLIINTKIEFVQIIVI